MEAPVTTATFPASRITLLVEGTIVEVKLSAQHNVGPGFSVQSKCDLLPANG
jgi:hypothetical protein